MKVYSGINWLGEGNMLSKIRPTNILKMLMTWFLIVSIAMSIVLWLTHNVSSADTIWQANNVATIKGKLSSTFDVNSRHYQIQYGDTINTVAEAFNANANTIVTDNGIVDANLILAGNQLYITKDVSGYVRANNSIGQVVANQLPTASLINEFDGNEITPIQTK